MKFREIRSKLIDFDQIFVKIFKNNMQFDINFDEIVNLMNYFEKK